MPGSTYSTNLKIELMTTGENSGTWGDITNTNLGTAFEQAVVGLGNPDYTSDANLTITITNSNASQAARCLVLNVTSAFGSLTATRELIVPTIQKNYVVQNNTAGGQSITVKTSAGTGITVPNGFSASLYVNGTNVVQMADFIPVVRFNSLRGTGAVTVTNILDEDNMASDSATALATQQSIKAYVDAQVGTVDTWAEVLANGNTSGNTNVIISVTDNTNAALRITQLGTGNALLVEDSTNPDSTPTVITAAGDVGIGTTTPLAKLNTYEVAGGSDANILFQNFSTTTSTAVALYLSPTNGSLTGGSIRAAVIKGINVGSGVTALTFSTNASGADPTEKMRINSSGSLLLGLTSSRTNNLSSASLLQLEAVNSAATGALVRNSADTSGAGLILGKSRGTSVGSFTAVVSGDRLGTLSFSGTDGTTMLSAATILSEVDGTPGTNDMPGRLVFSTTADGVSSPTERMRIDSSGNVGIGTTNIVGSAIGTLGTDGRALSLSIESDINGNSASNSITAGAKIISLSSITGSNSYVAASLGLHQPGSVEGIGDFRFSTGDGAGVLTERMRIDSSGNVGIGTNSPSEMLTVAGGIGSRVDTNATANLLIINSNAGSSAKARFRLSSDVVVGNLQANSSTATPQLALIVEGAYPLTFLTTNTERMRIDASGNVGIGTSSPTSTLSVTGTANVTGNVTLGDATTDTVTVNGYMGVGAAGAANVGMAVQNTALTGSGQYGLYSDITGTSAATSAISGLYLRVKTAASAFTVSGVYGAIIQNAGKGAGSTIANQWGLYVADQTQGTNNYGITSLVSSGTDKWNIYASGTAQNYFAGNVGIGTTTPSAKLAFGISDVIAEIGRIGFDVGGTQRAYIAANRHTAIGQLTDLSFGTMATERMRIDSSGNVGIGTSSPTSTLSVTGTANVTGNVTLGDATTDTVTVNGYMGVGVAPNQNINVFVQKQTVGVGQSQAAISTFGYTGSSDALNITGVAAYATSAAAATTVANVYGITASVSTKGAGSTITNAHGIQIPDLTQGTNNYGITSQVTSGTNKWNIYASGTAQNYFAGDVGIGVTTIRTTAGIAPKLQLESTTTNVQNSSISLISNSGTNNANSSVLSFGRSTTSAIGSVVAGSAGLSLGKVSFAGADGTGLIASSLIEAQQDSTASTGIVPGRILFSTANSSGTMTERMRIDSSGNLGLGVTPSAWATSFKAMQLGAGGFISGRTNTDEVYVGANCFFDTTDNRWEYIATDVATQYYQDAGTHVWRTAPSGTAGNAITFTQAMTLDASGNVGIGTTSPAAKLHVEGGGSTTAATVLVKNTSANSSTYGSVETQSDSTSALYLRTYSLATTTAAFGTALGGASLLGTFGAASTGMLVGTNNATPLILGTSNIERMRIDSGGNVQVESGAVMPYAPAPAAISTTATLTNANIQGQIISTTGTTYTVTMPLGTTLEFLAAWVTTNISYDFYVVNTASGTITMAVNTGVTAVGGLTIATGVSAHFRIRRTAASTFVLYRLC